MTNARAASADNISLRDDDRTILRELYESRVMTVNHIADIVFGGRKQTAHKRIQRLKGDKFIHERPRLPNQPSILYLGFTGYECVRKSAEFEELPAIPWAIFSRRVQVSNHSLNHELSVLDVKAAFLSAASDNPRYHVDQFSTWPRLFQFANLRNPGAHSLTKPDGCLHIIDSVPLSTQRFFLEVDRSTEVLDTLVRKGISYNDHYRSGRFAQSLGLARESYREVPFRVLIVLQNEERRNNLAERLLLNDPPLLSQMWLSTINETLTNPLNAIWMRPIDYREALQGSDFEPMSSNWETAIYRRNSERDRTVVERVTLQTLFDGSAA